MLGRRQLSGSELLEATREQVVALLPAGWSAVTAAVDEERPDLALEIQAPDGTKALLVVEAKSALEPKLVAEAADQLKRFGGWPIVAAPFLSSRTRDLLADAGIGYLDMTGNVLIRVDRPAIFIRTSGQERNPWSGERPGRSLRGAKAAAIVRLLCESLGELTVTQIAGSTKTDTGYVSRVLEVLERDALIERVPRGTIRRVAWEGLIRRWTVDYSVLKSNAAFSYVDPRELSRLPARFEKVTLRYALTGSFAVPTGIQVSPPRLLMAYVDDPTSIAEALSLKPTSTSPNVFLLKPFGDVVYERTIRRGGITCVAASQLAADLLTGPGRMPEEAEGWLGWMRKNEWMWKTLNP